MLKFKYDNVLGSTFLFLAFISIFNKPISGVLGVSFLNYLDEVILFICLLLITIMLLLSKKVKLIYFLVITFFIYSVVISVLFGYNRNFFDIVFQSIINIKFFIFILTFIIFFQGRYYKIKVFFKYVLAFALFGLALNVIFGITFNQFFDINKAKRSNTLIRYGGFLNPNHLAYLMVMTQGLIFNRAKKGTGFLTNKDWVIMLGSILVILLTDSRTAIVGVFIFFVSFYWSYLIRNAKILSSFLILSIVFAVFLLLYTNMWETLMINIQGSCTIIPPNINSSSYQSRPI